MYLDLDSPNTQNPKRRFPKAMLAALEILGIFGRRNLRDGHFLGFLVEWRSTFGFTTFRKSNFKENLGYWVNTISNPYNSLNFKTWPHIYMNFFLVVLCHIQISKIADFLPNTLYLCHTKYANLFSAGSSLVISFESLICIHLDLKSSLW